MPGSKKKTIKLRITPNGLKILDIFIMICLATRLIVWCGSFSKKCGPKLLLGLVSIDNCQGGINLAATHTSRSDDHSGIAGKVILRHANQSATQRYPEIISDVEAIR
ncbi:MAG: hypothetical protein QNJ01_14260 [Desulfobacterales bacterium]|nr:hypothetical protein [Desulfobacterales bacterium]